MNNILIYVYKLIMSQQKQYDIGDRVITTSKPVYDGKIPIGTSGTIIKIRKRYQDSPNAYCQYKIHVDGYDDGDDLTNLFDEMDIKSA